ncbi:MAG: DUF3086 domain-containing protein [Microcoleaceae cyanobacterium]
MNPDESQNSDRQKPLADPWMTSAESDHSDQPETSSSVGEESSLVDNPEDRPKIDLSPVSENTANLWSSEPTQPKPPPQQLPQDIASLQLNKAKLQQEQRILTESMGQLVSEALSQLEQRKQTLQVEVEKLERRRDRIRKEMRTSFAGVSQDLAIRVQGFKEYLVGSLQDLAVTAEQLELIPEAPPPTASPNSPPVSPETEPSFSGGTPQFGDQRFQDQTRQIRQLLDQYRTMPDYYGVPWQLRRTFEPIHAKRVANWFFDQGGRGALRTMGSRLQNILIASAIISVLRTLYKQRLRCLVLANSPERLGEWRRGLQDCLGLERRDFSPDRGVVLFEDPMLVAQKADRLVKEGKLPLIIVDDSEDKISLSLLQYPLWLAFSPEPETQGYTEQY